MSARPQQIAPSTPALEPTIGRVEAAAILGIHENTLYRLCKEGFIPHIMISSGSKRGVLRFRPSTLRAWMDEQEQKSRRA